MAADGANGYGLSAGDKRTVLSPPRVKARQVAARRFRETSEALVSQGHAGATFAALGRRLGTSRDHAAKLAGDGDPAVTVGDIDAMGSEFALAFAVRWIEDLDASSINVSARDSLDGVAIQLGESVKALHADLAADGREDEHERHAAALQRLAIIALKGAAAARRRARGGAL